MAIDDDFDPHFTAKDVGRLAESDWLNLEEPQMILAQGQRGAGKGVVIDSIIETMYHNGFNIWHIWGARSLENVYYIINKNCREHFRKLKIVVDAFYYNDENEVKLSLRQICKNAGLDLFEYDKQIELALLHDLIKFDGKKTMLTQKGTDFHYGRLLHCNCHKAIPVSWMVPNYQKFDEESVDRFNGFYWKDIDEYLTYRIDISKEERKLLNEGKLMKPSDMRPKPLVIVRKITPPTSPQRAEVFREEFIKIVLEAREEHRIVVMNPASFEGSIDKFETVAEIFKMLKYLMQTTEHFLKLTEVQVGKAKKYWSKKQLNWHKVAIVINELRTIAPSNQLSPEKDANRSKRAIYDVIPELRHYRIWFVADFQRSDDVLPTVKYNTNITIIKNGSRNLLGEDNKWLFDSTEKWQLNTANKLMHRDDIKTMGYIRFLKSKHPKSKLARVLDMKPCVDELKQNEGYVCWSNQEYKKVIFHLPSFHHKQTIESLMQDTGIKWSVETKKITEVAKTLTRTEKKQSIVIRKKVKEDVYVKIQYWRETQKKSWPQIKEELVTLQTDGLIPDMGYADKTPEYFSNRYGEWKKKQIEQVIA